MKIFEYELESGILESKVRWAIKALTNRKAPGHDGIPIEYYKALKEDGIELLTTLCRQMWETRQWPLGWKKELLKLPHDRSNLACQQNNVKDYTTKTTTIYRTRNARYTSRLPHRKRKMWSNCQHTMDNAKSLRISKRILFTLHRLQQSFRLRESRKTLECIQRNGSADTFNPPYKELVYQSTNIGENRI